MGVKNLNRRQILASGAALAAPMLALTTPTHVHAAWDACKRSGAISWPRLIASINWGKSVSNVLGTQASVRLGTRPNVSGTYMEVTSRLTKSITTIGYYRSVISGNSSGQSLTLYQLERETCTEVALITVQAQRCLVIPVDSDNDPSREAVGPNGTPSRPWLLNSSAGERLVSELLPNQATAGGSAQRYRELFGWIQYTVPIGSGGGTGFTATFRRLWAWDPAINRYRTLRLLIGTTIGDRVSFGEERPISNAAFQEFNRRATSLVETINGIDRSSMPFWDPVLLLSEAMRNIGNGNMLISSARQLAALSNAGQSGVEGYTNALAIYQQALNTLRNSDNSIWTPTVVFAPPSNVTDPTNPPRGPGGFGDGSLPPPQCASRRN